MSCDGGRFRAAHCCAALPRSRSCDRSVQTRRAFSPGPSQQPRPSESRLGEPLRDLLASAWIPIGPRRSASDSSVSRSRAHRPSRYVRSSDTPSPIELSSRLAFSRRNRSASHKRSTTSRTQISSKMSPRNCCGGDLNEERLIGGRILAVYQWWRPENARSRQGRFDHFLRQSPAMTVVSSLCFLPFDSSTMQQTQRMSTLVEVPARFMFYARNPFEHEAFPIAVLIPHAWARPRVVFQADLPRCQ